MILEQQQFQVKRRKTSHLDPAFQRRSFNDQRAALSLAELAARQEEIGANADGVAQLTYALIAQADGDQINDAATPTFNLDPTNAAQREEMLKVRRLIDSFLASAAAAAPRIPSAPQVSQARPAPRTPDQAPSAPKSPAPDRQPAKRQHLDVATSDAIEVRSEGGFERTRLSGGLDEREAHSAPSSRPSSRRETRKSSRRSAIFK